MPRVFRVRLLYWATWFTVSCGWLPWARAETTPQASPTPETAASQAQTPPVICPICHVANDQNAPYLQKAGTTLMRGATNTVFGWTEMILQPVAEANEGGNLLTGIGKGVGYSVKRTAVGIGELLTFWTPKDKRGSAPLTKDCPICMTKP
mgnify:CR=1 FL=1